ATRSRPSNTSHHLLLQLLLRPSHRSPDKHEGHEAIGWVDPRDLLVGGAIVKSCGRRVLIDHAATLVLASSGRSMSIPFSNFAPARTSATRCGPLTARHRSCAAWMSLN